MKKGWWLDTVHGVLLTIILMGFSIFDFPFTESFEKELYDLRLKISPKEEISDQILLVAIDDLSISNVGRWPWPRGYIAQLINNIAAGSPKVIGVNIFYVDPDKNQGLEIVRELEKSYQAQFSEQKNILKPLLRKAKKDNRYKRYLKKDPFEGLTALSKDFKSAKEALDNDAQLAETLMATPRVVLPLFFSVDKPLADETDEALTLMEGYSLPEIIPTNRSEYLTEGYEPLIPIKNFVRGASGLGHVNMFRDNDGSMRREAILIRYQDTHFPSFSLEMARVALGLNPDEIQVELGQSVRLGDKVIPLEKDNQMLINYQGKFSNLNIRSAVEVLAEKIPPEAFKNKIVLIGATATGIGTLFETPMETSTPANGIIATVLQNVLGERFIRRPDWAVTYEMLNLLFIGLIVVFLLPFLRAKKAAMLSSILLILSALLGVYFFVAKGYWIKIFYSMALLVLSYTVITLRRFFFTEKRKELVEAESIETNKMLGLSFQGQGMLDMAFEKFRKCPIDDPMKDVLYNLALDYERKRQFNKASVVYEHISDVDPKYKDIKERQKATKSASETMIVGGGLGGGKREGTVVVEGAGVKPTLGRYEIEKELGRGAMGVVYLGKDPKINRLVAIKTLRFDDDDLDDESIKEIKERFFREAESAGTLNHPNIVRIFDAGDDNDISFIAMELLDGEDLKKYGEKKNLLPVPKVMEYIATIADALDYAHSKGVVHRDIKPANIMKLKDGSLRVTDFGIARITATSKTQTGTVLGTPSYMSPEQVAGKKVDGRADLFSLGVMFYEMLTGEKPFQGDSIATLLFQISNGTYPDPISKNKERVSSCVKKVLDKALKKNSEDRYQKGSEIAKDIRECLQNPTQPLAGNGTETVKLKTAEAVPPVASAPAPLSSKKAETKESYPSFEGTQQMQRNEDAHKIETKAGSSPAQFEKTDPAFSKPKKIKKEDMAIPQIEPDLPQSSSKEDLTQKVVKIDLDTPEDVQNEKPPSEPEEKKDSPPQDGTMKL